MISRERRVDAKQTRRFIEKGAGMDKRPVSRPVIAAAMMITTVLVGIAVKQTLKYGWRKSVHREPPENPKQAGWRDTIIWTILTGILGSLAKLFAQMGEERIARKFR